MKYDGRKFDQLKNIPEGATLFLYDDTLNNSLVMSSAKHGLIILDDNGDVKKFFISPGLVQEYISTIIMDTLGRYWIGGFYGYDSY